MKKIVHITPTLPPAINGLGDFSYLMAQTTKELIEAEIVFAVNDLPPGDLEFKVIDFNAGNLYTKVFEQNPDVVVIHFVIYAYQKKGLPFYMPKVVKQLKKTLGCKILVYFHELYAVTTNVLSSAFFIFPLQKIIVRQLYNLADQTFTNCVYYKTRLSNALGGKPNNVIITGLYSNIPEAYYDHNIAKDESCMVIFGSATSRSNIYTSTHFASVIEKLGVKTIYDIGAGDMNCNVPGVLFKKLGKLPAEDIAVYLNKATYGAIEYPIRFLGKSGIQSAYAAFEVIPINFNELNQPLLDGLTRNVDYFDYNSPLPITNKQAVRDKLRLWYSQRNRMAVTKKVIEHF
ncbi:glycosyltransferase family 4 protein [Mucilaginibacter aquatilis]|uniref:Glycosyltransferase family 1 protein n=1 Tax=Mucilaginibacter aquatilis TaxID=1517760 RepID=A0A6I4IAZ4_9SPHI|nr:hypothetical protein [Mucilaginibacter aquatilis]MVN92127.1 hypothetical protein [Mucilaginibacter aquatilis]